MLASDAIIGGYPDPLALVRNPRLIGGSEIMQVIDVDGHVTVTR
jgi:hypothetical protein